MKNSSSLNKKLVNKRKVKKNQSMVLYRKVNSFVPSFLTSIGLFDCPFQGFIKVGKNGASSRGAAV